MSKPKINEKRTSTFIPYDVFDKFKSAAHKKGITVSTLLRMLILEYLDKHIEKD